MEIWGAILKLPEVVNQRSPKKMKTTKKRIPITIGLDLLFGSLKDRCHEYPVASLDEDR